MLSGLITLTTDFGGSDHFTGAMKGVILSIAPRARIVDITHHIAPFEVASASFAIGEAWRYFPKGTVHVVVVDPGVGSARRPILVEAEGHWFVAPDNGVLSMIYDSAPHKVRVISNTGLMRKEVSRTFHGRDIFAPAAAHLVRKIPAARFGKMIHDYVRWQAVRPVEIEPGRWSGTILHIDRFGNVVTNFHIGEFPGIGAKAIELRIGSKRVRRFVAAYSEANKGQLVVIAGSSGYLEIAANQARAAEMLGCGAGAAVELRC